MWDLLKIWFTWHGMTPKSITGISDVLTGASRSPIPQYFENWKKVDQKSAILKEKRLQYFQGSLAPSYPPEWKVF